MADNIYKETFSHVRSSYTVNVEDFERMKTKKKAPVGKILLIAAVAAVLAAFGVTAAATDFFGLNAVTIDDGESDEGLISMQGYRDSDEYKALYDHYYGGLSLEEAAEKYGLTVPERCEVFTYEEVAGALGGDPTDGRNTRWVFYVYEDGTFGSDQEFTSDDGTVIGYQMYRSVKGSLTEVSLNADLGDDLEEWDLKLGGFDVGLVLGSDSRSLIIADLGESFFTANVLAGKRADPTFGGPITRGQLEELAGSISWETLSNVAVPEFPPEEPEVQFGAGVELLPEYIDESQSFEVTLRDYGRTHFITYMPTSEFNDVRFFLSADGKVSDYEFHPMFDDNTGVSVAAVSFEDLNGDGNADVLVLIDYVSVIGEPYRAIRVFTYSGDGEYELDWQLSEAASEAIPEEKLDVAAVRRYCKEYFAGGQGAKDQLETEDQVVSSCTIEEGGKSYYLEAFGKRARNDDRWGIREIRVYPYGDDGKPLAEPVQMIRIVGAGEDFIDGLYAGYTECPDKEGVMTVQDMNFDGYPDIGVFAITPNNTIPYYYWFWNEGAGGFEYAITLQGAEVDEENRQVVATYKSGVGGSEYVYEYYEPDGDGKLMLVRTEVEMYGDWVEANDYDGILNYLQSVYSDEFWLNYGLFDLTGDGTDELIATSGTCEADAMAGVWSMDTGRMRKLGAFGMGHSLLYVEDGKLIRLMGQMGFEQIWKISYDGKEVTETLLSERQLGPEEDYRTFDEPFEMYPDSERLALHGNGRYDCYLDVLDSVGEEGEYALFDLERDGTLELIVAEGRTWSFWTVEDERAKPLGELDSTKSGLYEDEGHSLVVFYSNMSGAEIRRVYFDGEKVDTVYLTGWEWHEGVAGEDPGEMVPFYPAGDRSRLS